MTYSDLYSSFRAQALKEWGNDNIYKLWIMIEPYLDESKFISQDEKDFEEYWKSHSLSETNIYAKDIWKTVWLAARKK